MGRENHIGSLTGLRFVAAAAVLVSHSILLLDAGFYDALRVLGPIGLTGFFCLSGFVLTWTYYEDFRNGWSSAAGLRYGLARVARVYPLFFVLLVVDIGRTGFQPGGLQNLAVHAGLVQAWLPEYSHVEQYFPVSWTLSVEAFFYACFPFIVIQLSRKALNRQRVLIALALGCVAISCVAAVTLHRLGADRLAFENPDSASRWLRFFPPARLPDFVLGCLLARLYALRRAGGVSHSRLLLVLAGVSVSTLVGLMATGVLLRHYHSDTGANFSALGWDAAWIGPVGILILWLAERDQSAVARVLRTRVFLLLGASSYALYLCHQFFVFGVTTEAAARAIPAVAPSTSVGVMRLVGTWLLAIMCSIGLYVAIEEPCRRWIKTRVGIRVHPSALSAQDASEARP